VAFPSDGQATDLVEQGDALLHDGAQPARTLMVFLGGAGLVGRRWALRRRAGPPALLMSGTSPPVVITVNGVPTPSVIT